MTAKPFHPDVAKIVTDLRSGHVHVDPTLDSAITAKQLAQIKTTVAGSDVPTFVVAVPLDITDQLSAIQLIALIHRELPKDGVYFVSQSSYDGTWTLASTSYGVVTDNANALAGYVADELYPADLGLQLQKATELLANGTAEQAYNKTFPERQSHSGTSSSTDGGGSHLLGMSPPIAGVALGLVIVLVAATVPLLRRRKRADHELAVKGRALRRISTAQTQDWRHRAETESAALGDRINTLQIADTSNREAWSAALDHYDAATRVLDRSDDAADSIGAIVLARRGDDALDHAVAGQVWTATAACFFNPLHGPATSKVRWKTSVGSRDVPCCADCRQIVRKRQEPDFLDLPVGDTVVHYIDSDAEPWASTGYGSLDPDLLSKI